MSGDNLEIVIPCPGMVGFGMSLFYTMLDILKVFYLRYGTLLDSSVPFPSEYQYT